MGKSLVHYFVNTDDERQAYMDEMRPLARKFQEYLAFTTVDANEYPDMEEMLGLERGASRALSVQMPSTGAVYPYTDTEALTASIVEQFLMAIIQGQVKPWQPGMSRGSSPLGGAAMGHDEL